MMWIDPHFFFFFFFFALPPLLFTVLDFLVRQMTYGHCGFGELIALFPMSVYSRNGGTVRADLLQLLPLRANGQ